MRKLVCSCGQTLLFYDYAKIEIKCPRCKKIIKLDTADKIKSRKGTRA